MKKFGFTLAEVLITLAIIGVVAVLTLPALMNNVGEQQYTSGLKKGINTLSEAGQMSHALDGFSYDDVTANSATNQTAANEGGARSLYGILLGRVQIDESSTNQQGANLNMGTFTIGTGNFAIFMRDGSILQYNPSESSQTIASDGHIDGIRAVLDVNGLKGPNMSSTCGATEGTECTNQNKSIKDQFPIIIRDNYARPNNNAGRYAIMH